MRYIPSPGWTHQDICVRCGAGPFAPCRPTCAFEVGAVAVADLLRATAYQLPGQMAGNGYHIGSTLQYTGNSIVGDDRSATMWDEAMDAVAAVLPADDGKDRDQLVWWYGLTHSLDDVARTLYAAAAQAEGIPFDAEAFDLDWN